MGKPAARKEIDVHTCPMTSGSVPHVGGLIIEGCSTVSINGQPAARKGDKAACTGAVDTIQTGSTKVSIGGQPAAREGDQTIHGGFITSGSPNVNIG